ncbi:MAG: transaldolase [Armatimonadetes bacterium]|nr:transaldolase [Armatimonadota bacterium]
MSTKMNIHADPEVTNAVKELALEEFEGAGSPGTGSVEKYRRLRAIGTRLWLDTGDLEAASKVWSSEIDALTTNNTLVNQVVQTGAMDSVIPSAAARIRASRSDISDQELVIEIAFLVNARLALGLVSKLGVHVSVELHPGTALNVEQTLVFARRYYEINPEYFYVKVPLTPDGFIAARRLSAEGIPVNYTLGFSARQNYLATRFSMPSFVNVFLGRLNSVVEENGLGNPENVGEKAALASDEFVKELRKSRDDIPTSQIAASIRHGGQVATLAGVDVQTIPPKAAAEYLAMDIASDQIRKRTSQELDIELAHDGLARVVDLNVLWDVDERFIGFVEDAVSQADEMVYGRDLMRVAREHGINIFREWTNEERRAIREHGKIPDLAQWPGAPIDDLMSISALESFAQDQSALDDRIKSFLT